VRAAVVEAAFLPARQRGNEGLMAKDPESIYLPEQALHGWKTEAPAAT
jgi:ATP-dependent DNA ligase